MDMIYTKVFTLFVLRIQLNNKLEIYIYIKKSVIMKVKKPRDNRIYPKKDSWREIY